eukprot:INCI12239.1.p1 GENE.INCI12239.1~~INCI12239.1.p1  ORF type:complete len:324 (+),score=58.02 INCI12239.1:166-1137(+)
MFAHRFAWWFCLLVALPVNLGAQQRLSLDATRVQQALEALNATSDTQRPSAVQQERSGSPVFPADTAPVEMLLKCRTTCAFEGPNLTHSSNSSTCVRCLDRTASDIIDRVISTQEQLTSFRIKTRADRGLYSRKEEARLTAAHEAAVLQLRNAVAPAQPSTVPADPTTASNGTLGNAAGKGLQSRGQAQTLQTGEAAKMKQTSGKILSQAPSLTASSSSSSSSSSSLAAASSLSTSSSTSSVSSYAFFSPRQECYRVCGNAGDVNHDSPLPPATSSSASFVEVESQMLAEEFSSMGTLEQCIRLCVRITKNTVTKLAAASTAP